SIATIFRSYKTGREEPESSSMDRPSSGHGNRSLNLSQTLDELLGIGKKEETDQKKTGVTRITDLTQIRPPTRHGPDERTETTTISVVDSFGKSRRGWEESGKKSEENTVEAEEDFIQRLNDSRRRSIVILSPSSTSSKSSEDALKLSPQNGSSSSTASSEPRTFRVDTIDEEGITPRNEEKIEKKEEEKGEEALKEEKLRPGTAKKKPPVPMPRSVSASAPPKRPPSAPFVSSLTRPMSSMSGKSSHDNWLAMKREADMEKRRVEKQKEEDKKREEEMKKKTSIQVFDRWKADRDALLKEKREKERETTKKQAEEKLEAEKIKRGEAAKVFEAWKKTHARSLSEASKRMKEKEERDKMKKAREIEEKQIESQAAFEAWIEKNKKREREEKMKRIQREEEEEEEKYAESVNKQILAYEAYQTWLEIKEKEDEIRMALEIRNAMYENGNASQWTPWRPPSNTIPRTFTPTGNRCKSLERRKPPSRAASAHVMRRSASVKSVKV
ncbi:hypothetical protein PFISCL1PPCAC_16131, partial [Pristionchus fissidentatus]